MELGLGWLGKDQVIETSAFVLEKVTLVILRRKEKTTQHKKREDNSRQYNTRQSIETTNHSVTRDI
jgi:hypothetical protein